MNFSRLPTQCYVSDFDREVSVMWRPRKVKAVALWTKRIAVNGGMASNRARDLDPMKKFLRTWEHKRFQRRQRPSQVLLKISLF